MQSTQQQATDGYIPLVERLKAWWDGSSTTQIRTAGSGAAAASDIMLTEPQGDKRRLAWPPERIALVQQLWGDGATRPGGVDYTVALLRPLSIQPEMTVLDLSAGLAGATSAASDEFNAWITAMEPDPDLANVASGICSRKVTVSHYQTKNLDLPTAKFDCIYAREQLCFLPDRKAALATICGALKPYGQVVLTDYAVASQAGGDTLANWQAQHPTPEPLWTPKVYRRHLDELNLDVRVFQDDSDHIKSMVLQGWSQFVSELKRPQLTRTFVDSMVFEADRWLRTVRALDAGELRFLRVHAIAKGNII